MRKLFIKNYKIVLPFILICVAVFVSGCTQKGDSEDPVLARINGTKITKKDFLNKLNRLPEWARGRFQDKEGKEQFLDELIKQELLYQEARKAGLHRDKEFKARVEEFKKTDLIGALLKKEVDEKAKVDDKEVKDFYDKNPSHFKAGEEVKASHILLSTEDEARAALERVKKGEDFAKLAKTLSKDRDSAKRGGDLGFFGRGKMVPEFEEVAFNLKTGEVSSPLKTQFGYHIIKVTSRKEGKMLDFEEVKDSIKRRLIVERQKDLFDSLIERLKRQSKIEIDKRTLEALPVEGKQTPPTPR